MKYVALKKIVLLFSFALLVKSNLFFGVETLQESIFSYCNKKFISTKKVPLDLVFLKKDLDYLTSTVNKTNSIALRVGLKGLNSSFQDLESQLKSDRKIFQEAVLEFFKIAVEQNIAPPDLFAAVEKLLDQCSNEALCPIGIFQIIHEINEESDICKKFAQRNKLLSLGQAFLKKLNNFHKLAMAKSFVAHEISSQDSRKFARTLYGLVNGLTKLSPDALLKGWVDKASDRVVDAGFSFYQGYSQAREARFTKKYPKEPEVLKDDYSTMLKALQGMSAGVEHNLLGGGQVERSEEVLGEKPQEGDSHEDDPINKQELAKMQEQLAKLLKVMSNTEKDTKLQEEKKRLEFEKSFDLAANKVTFSLQSFNQVAGSWSVGQEHENKLSQRDKEFCLKLLKELSGAIEIISKHEQMKDVCAGLQASVFAIDTLGQVLRSTSTNNCLIVKELCEISQAISQRLFLMRFRAKTFDNGLVLNRSNVTANSVGRFVIPILVAYLFGKVISKDGVGILSSCKNSTALFPKDPSWLDGIRDLYQKDQAILSFDVFSDYNTKGFFLPFMLYEFMHSGLSLESINSNPITALIACIATSLGRRSSKFKGPLDKLLAVFVTANLVRLCLLPAFKSWARDEITGGSVPAHLGLFAYKFLGVPTVAKTKIKAGKILGLHREFPSSKSWPAWFNKHRNSWSRKADLFNGRLKFGSLAGSLILGIPQAIGSAVIGCSEFFCGPLFPILSLDLLIPLTWKWLCGNGFKLNLENVLNVFIGKGLIQTTDKKTLKYSTFPGKEASHENKIDLDSMLAF